MSDLGAALRGPLLGDPANGAAALVVALSNGHVKSAVALPYETTLMRKPMATSAGNPKTIRTVLSTLVSAQQNHC